jgi:RHS repeat-associated protein
VFTHDLDGNLTSDGRWTYTWDAENRLLRVQSRSDTPQASWRRVEWQYDALGRRIRQTTWSWLVQSNLWVVTEDLKFLSDPLLFGRHVVDLNASNNVAVRTYVWGLDLSETMEAAGGVGGLLWVTLHPGSGAGAGTHFCAYDGNGNIVALSAASDGSVSARYEYGPFAEPIRVTGPAAPLNPFRFSTKRTCHTTDLVLYEYRAYSPSTGRWPSRDPIGQKGGANVYGFVANDPVQFTDMLGLYGNPVPPCAPYPECLNEPPSPGSWSLALPDFQFSTGQSVQFKGCMPIGGPVSLCLAGGWTLRIGNCCNKGQKKGYFRIQANATVTFEVGISTPFTVSYTKPVVENLPVALRRVEILHGMWFSAYALALPLANVAIVVG